MLSGRYGTEVGITDWINPEENAAGVGLPPETTTWAEALQRAGYRTGLIGKWHLGARPRVPPDSPWVRVISSASWAAAPSR